MPRFPPYLLLLSLIALLAISAPSFAQEPKKEASPAFKQYLGVYTKNAPQQQIVLQHAKIKQLGDRTFLVGTPVAVKENSTKLEARKDVVWWIALSEVTEFYEFEEVRGYRYDGKEPRFTGQ